VAVVERVRPAAAAVGMATTVTVTEAPGARVPRLQVIVVVPVQVPWLGVTETSVVFGSGSLNVTFVAVPGP
jgi:hypothetical protein